MRTLTAIIIASAVAIIATGCGETNQESSVGLSDDVQSVPTHVATGSETDDEEVSEESGVTNSDGEVKTERNEQDSPEAPTDLDLADVVVASGLDEMVEQSRIIFVGRVDAPEEIVNTARNVNNVNEPDPRIVILGQVYRVEVEDYLKGDGPDVQNVVQSEGFIYHDDERIDIPSDQDEIDEAKEQSGEVLIQSGERYLFFANPLRGFDPDLNYIVGDAGYPTRFLLQNDGIATQESPIEHLNETFAPRTTEDLLREVKSLIQETAQ